MANRPKKKKNKNKKLEVSYEIESDEYYYYIVGYTSGGEPYGITWEEAYEQGLAIEENVEIDENLF
ncbi:hypothetical protein [Romboutsia sp.]|uniref:hypothetical protein n=1 Tax=Romboutsia sp. TaxID=1965302 RepID=UPI003F2C0D6F